MGRRSGPIILAAYSRRMKKAASSFGLAWMLLALALPAPAGGADPVKTLRVTFQAAETGFDPAKIADVYSGSVAQAIFEPLLTYDYLARPAIFSTGC